MNYYYMEPLLNEKNGAPQIITISPNQDINDDESIYSFGRIDFPARIKVNYLNLDKTAQITDVICAHMLILTGLLVNDKVRSLIGEFILPDHRYYAFKVKDIHNNIFQYYWLQTSSARKLDIGKYLNFRASQFVIQRRIGHYEDVEISDFAEFSRIQSELTKYQYITLKKARMNSEFDKFNLDLFKIPGLYTYWIISERLKTVLDKEKISGVVVKNADGLI